MNNYSSKRFLAITTIPTNINNPPTITVHGIKPKTLKYHISGRLTTTPMAKIIRPIASKIMPAYKLISSPTANDYYELFCNIQNKSLAFNFIVILDDIMEVCLSNMNCFAHSIFRGNLLPFNDINRGKYRECNGRIKPGNSCETNAERGKYIRLQEKKGEKNYWRKKIQTRTGTGKKETSYLTSTGDFCPPTKISISFYQKQKTYFSLFPQDTHTFPLHGSLFSPTYFPLMSQVYVLKPLSFFHREKTVISKIGRLGGIFANAPTIQSTLRRFSCCC